MRRCGDPLSVTSEDIGSLTRLKRSIMQYVDKINQFETTETCGKLYLNKTGAFEIL